MAKMRKCEWKALLTTFSLMALLSGCRPDPTVWRTEVQSPDGAWLAVARTDQYGGFGSAWVGTIVSLKKLDGTVNRGKPFDVLEYPDGGPIHKAYTLSDENAGGGVNLHLRWTSPRYLQIDYTGSIKPDLQVVKFGGVDIGYHQGPTP